MSRRSIPTSLLALAAPGTGGAPAADAGTPTVT